MRILITATDPGVDCWPLTVNTPPPLLRVLDRSILERNLDSLVGLVEYVTVVVGFGNSPISDVMGGEFGDIRIEYVEADVPADESPADLLRLDGAALYSSESLSKAVAGDIDRLGEGSISVRYPWNYLEANVQSLRAAGERIDGVIEDGVTVKGDIILEEDAVIRSGSYIEGPVYIGRNSIIGPFAHIRPDTIIEGNCEIGKSELYDCVVMRGTTCKHQAYIGHSVIGENVNVGAGLITADYRHDGGSHSTLVAGRKVDTGRRKLGAFIGDDVRTAVGTLIYPGRKIWPGFTTLPGEVVAKDKSSL